jgi:hypothetical protein
VTISEPADRLTKKGEPNHISPIGEKSPAWTAKFTQAQRTETSLSLASSLRRSGNLMMRAMAPGDAADLHAVPHYLPDLARA